MKQTFRPLGDLAEFINGIAFRPEDWGETGTKIVRIQNLTDPSKPFNRTLREIEAKFVANRGDLLVSWSASLGVFEWGNDEPAFVNQHIFKVVPKNGHVDKNYLRHALVLALDDMGKHLHGATMQHVNRGEFLGTKIPLPPMEEQRRIAAILDQAEALLAKRRQALAKLDTLTQSLFLEMFGDPRVNPKQWNMGCIAELGEVAGGLQLTPKRQQYEMKAPYLRVANVHRDRVDVSEIKTMGLLQTELLRTTLRSGDLLIVEGHGNAKEIGRCAVWDGQIADCVHQNHLIRVRFDSRYIDPHFASTYLNSNSGREQVLRSGKTTSGLNTLSTTNVKSFRIYVPPKVIQDEFRAAQLKIRQSSMSAFRHLSSLEGLCSSLQHRVFCGAL